jgi:hypothetical protein
MTRNEARKRLIEYGLTPAQAEALITEAEEKYCEPTSRLDPYPTTTIEYKASATYDGITGVDVYYYPEEDDINNQVEMTGGDLSGVNWVIDHYATW